jgi:phage-related protein
VLQRDESLTRLAPRARRAACVGVDDPYNNTYTCIDARLCGVAFGRVAWVLARRPQEISETVRIDIGQALYAAQRGETDPAAKPLKGFGGARVMGIVDRHDSNTYRTVYTVQFDDAIHVLHAFQKKSKSGIATPKHDIDLIRRRLADAERLHRERQR